MNEGANLKVAVVGGDSRQRLVADELTKRGYKVSEYAVGGEAPQVDLSLALAEADVLI